MSVVVEGVEGVEGCVWKVSYCGWGVDGGMVWLGVVKVGVVLCVRLV